MKKIYAGISANDMYQILEELNVSNNGEVFLHSTNMEKSDATEKTKNFFEKGISKEGKTTNKYMSILSTLMLVKDEEFDSEIIRYSGYGNCTMIVRIPEVYKSLHLGKASKKYAGTTTGQQDVKSCILDFLELEYIPREFIVGCLRKNIPDDGKYDFIVNPYYFEINPNNDLEERLIEAFKKKTRLVKDYVGIEKLSDESFENLMRFYEEYLKGEFVQEFKEHRALQQASKNKKTLQ